MTKIPVDNDNLKKRRIPEGGFGDQRYRPKDTTTVKKLYWSFGFKYFRQIDFFGLSYCDNSWFASLFGRLQETSKMEYTGLTEVLDEGYRYHIINWNAKNIPLQRQEFDWVDKKYLNNEDEYPFCQFHVSKGKGRIVGFWDENNIFQIVVLDPLHNLQPSNYNEYELRECYPAQSEYESILRDIEETKAIGCEVADCKTFKRLFEIPSYINNTNVILAHLDDEFHATYKELLQKKTFTEILQAGIVQLME